MKVTIIIPNYNGLKFMKPCMKALECQNYKEYELLVIDNASTDGSIEFMAANYPEIPLLKMEKNLGFSGAVNVGIKKARTPYVILLNNDTEVHEDYVGELVKAIEKDKRIFSVSSKMIQLYHKELIDDAGDNYCLLGWAYQRGVGQPAAGYNKECNVFSACAGAAIYRRKVFEKIGYFDELHFAYLEDLDIGYRAKLYGYKNRYCPSAFVYHVGSGTSGSKYNDFKVRLAARNSIYLLYKNMPILQLLFNILPLLCGYLLKYRFFIKQGYGKQYKEAFLEGLRTRKQCQKVTFKPKNLWVYIRIQFELILNTFIYVYEYGKRKW